MLLPVVHRKKTCETETSQVNLAFLFIVSHVKSMSHPQSFFSSLAPPLRLVCDMDRRSWWLRWGTLPALDTSVRVGAYDTFSLLLGEHVAHVLYVCIAHGDESRISADHKV
jgi:hypothetical protein